MADIHSNLPALTAAVRDAKARGAQKFIFCGDYVGDGPDTELIFEQIRRLGDVIIRGNREQYMLDYRAGRFPEWDDSRQFCALLWIYNRISPQSLDWFETLPAVSVLELGGKKLCISHGSPYLLRDNVKKDGSYPTKDRMLADFGADIYVTAHTHKQFHEEYGGALFINPGSVGMPTDTPAFKYTLLTVGEETEVCPVALPYDYAQMERYYDTYDFCRSNGVWARIFLASLRDGRDYLPQFVSGLHILAKQYGLGGRENIPDELWEEAARRFPPLLPDTLKG